MLRNHKKNGVRVLRKAIGISIVLAVAFLFNPTGLANDINEDMKTDIESMKYEINISQRSVEDALKTLAKQTGIQLLFPFDLVNTLNAHPVKGQYGVMEALEILLQDTGLYGGLTDSGVITISQNGFNKNGKGKRMNTNKRKNLLATFVALFASGATVQANAQNEFGESATAQRALDEIIVTAEKREQNLQDVPVAISAFSADMLEARGISTPQDLQLSVPGLSISENIQAGTAKVTMRGIGSENFSSGGDPGVPLHVNGHYSQFTAYMLRDMLDVERIEVQRGPQGTLYGRNAVGGNVNIITKRPTEEFEGLISGDVGSYSKRQIQAVVSGPLSDGLRGRLVVSDEDRDGYVENLGSGKDLETSDYTSVRGALEFDLTEDIQVYLNAYQFDDSGVHAVRLTSDYPTASTFSGGPNYWIVNGAGTNPTKVDPFQVRTNAPATGSDESSGVSLDVNWNLGGIEIRSLTAYDDSSVKTTDDADGSDLVSSEAHYDFSSETFTQEFQVLSTNENELNWVAGLYYYKENADFLFDSFREAGFDTNGDALINGDDLPFQIVATTVTETVSYAAYGQLDYAFTDQLELVAGLRYTKDKKERPDDGVLFGVALTPPFVFSGGGDKNDWSKVTGKLGLNYHINDDAMVYASYSRGYKSGGYNTTQADAYDPEFLDAYEVGLKSRWLGDRIQTNLAAFYYDYQDKQDIQRIPIGGRTLPFLTNASAATVTGFELEVQAHVLDGLQFDFSLGYLNAEFDEYDNLDVKFPVLGVQDLSGNQLPYSPEWKMHFGAQYDWLLSGNRGSLSIRGDYSWIDERWTNGFNRLADGVVLTDGDLLDDYSIVNARLQWNSPEAIWNIELYGKNLTDEIVKTHVFDQVGPVALGTFLPPRTYGAKVTYKF